MAIIAIALAVLAAPIPIHWQQMKASSAAMAGQGTVIAGHSVMSHVSACDADRRALPAAMDDLVEGPVTKANFPGQTFGESLSFAAMGVESDRNRAVVLFLSIPQLLARPTLDLRTAAFFRMAAGSYSVTHLGSRLHASRSLTEGPSVEMQPFTYRGVAYPGYQEVKVRYMMAERTRQRCPEDAGGNKAFVEALTWNNYLRSPMQNEYVVDVGTLAARARQRSKPLLVVLLPIDVEDARAMSPQIAAAIERRRAEVFAALTKVGVRPLDMSNDLPAAAFADRWCACGHLQGSGRRHVAKRVAERLAQPI